MYDAKTTDCHTERFSLAVTIMERSQVQNPKPPWRTTAILSKVLLLCPYNDKRIKRSRDRRLFLMYDLFEVDVVLILVVLWNEWNGSRALRARFRRRSKVVGHTDPAWNDFRVSPHSWSFAEKKRRLQNVSVSKTNERNYGIHDSKFPRGYVTALSFRSWHGVSSGNSFSPSIDELLGRCGSYYDNLSKFHVSISNELYSFLFLCHDAKRDEHDYQSRR